MTDQLDSRPGSTRRVARLALLASAAIPISIAVFAASSATGQPTPQQQQPPTPQQLEQDYIKKYCTSSTKTSIPAGSKAQAELYYRDLGTTIGFNITATTKLDDVLTYLGYSARGSATPITAKELQDASPADLMDVAKLGKRLGGMQLTAGDVLVARFFAPKISDLSQAKVTLAGWRKLVLLRTQPGAPAAGKIEYGIILFNFFAALSAPDPFLGNDSVNTQTILVGADAQAQLYWLDFDTTASGAGIRHSLSAFFDAGRVPPTATQNAQGADYFVPCGCVSCHGGLRMNFSTKSVVFETKFRAPLLDYLDTDHWEDRILPGDDFNGLAAPVLFDRGAFGVILQVNQMIARQNAAAQPDSMLRNAADHWVSYHLINGNQTQPLFERAHANSGRAVQWDQNNPIDRDLLPKLNRLCFRCHGSVRFDVFDKEMVIALKSQLNAALQPRGSVRDQRKAMPPDRTLTPAELAQLRDFIKRLQP